MKVFQTNAFWIFCCLIVALIFFQVNCHSGKTKPVEIIKTTIDTVYTQVKGDTVYTPKLISTSTIKYVPKMIHDTTHEYVSDYATINPCDTNNIARYSDTQHIKTYGTIIINDSLRKNRIISRNLITDLQLPTITKTVEKTIIEKRTIAYIGIEGIGNATSPLYKVGVDLSLKLKNDNIYGIGALYGKDNILYYQAEAKFPIHLKKK